MLDYFNILFINMSIYRPFQKPVLLFEVGCKTYIHQDNWWKVKLAQSWLKS